MPQREIEGGKRRHLFMFCFDNWIAIYKKIKIYGSNKIYE